MSRCTAQPHQREQAVKAARAAAELLEVFWGRGQDAAPSGPVSPSQLRALLVIEGYEGANLRTLSEILGSRSSSLSRLFDRMEAMGLVVRSQSPTSRREVELRLSRRGHRALEEYRALRAREVEVVLDRMEPSDIVALAEGLGAFRAAAARRFAELDRVPADSGKGHVVDRA